MLQLVLAQVLLASKSHLCFWSGEKVF